MIVLASQSPRRQELLHRIGLHDFDIRVPEADESYPPDLTPEEVVCCISRKKALAARDLVTEDDVKVVLTYLCEKVAQRLRQQRCLCSLVHLNVRDKDFFQYTRQTRLAAPSSNGSELFRAAWALFCENHGGMKPVRHLSVGAAALRFAGEAAQLSLFQDEQRALRRAALDETLDRLRDKYGGDPVRKGILMKAPELVQYTLPSSFGAIMDGS